METSTSEKSVKLPLFDGDEEKFQIYWLRMKAYASVMKYSQALKETRDPNMPDKDDQVLDSSDDEDKKMIEAKMRNSVAMANFTSGFLMPTGTC